MSHAAYTSTAKPALSEGRWLQRSGKYLLPDGTRQRSAGQGRCGFKARVRWSHGQQTRVKAPRWFQGHQSCVRTIPYASDTHGPPVIPRHGALPCLLCAT